MSGAQGRRFPGFGALSQRFLDLQGNDEPHAHAAPMRIQLKRGQDGRDTLACHREDGTATWAPLHDFMAVHDLTHYAVETVLGLQSAFLGLLDQGWDIADFEDKTRRQAMPEEALVAEVLVGQLDLERMPANQRTFPEFMEALGLAMAGQGAAVPPSVTPEALARIRSRRAELMAAWARTAPGDSLDLPFPA